MLVVLAWCATAGGGEQTSRVISPQPIDLTRKAVNERWFEWVSIADLKGLVAERERITALSNGEGEAIWVGTSRGRLLTLDADRWTLQAAFGETLQITGIAVESPNTVWLSTSDGIRRLDRTGNQWKLSEFRHYYQGHPSFVSGGYIPGEDAVRLWGYVDHIYIPPRIKVYSPMVVSTEHGLFTWGGYGGVWHHLMPHYPGANSAWLDTRDLIPHRRPTCITEDRESNLWIGTESDGLVRFNAKGREYHRRDAKQNQLDGSEFSHFSSDQVGWGFERVENVSPGLVRGLWCILSNKEQACHRPRSGRQVAGVSLAREGRQPDRDPGIDARQALDRDRR
jgi:hypothetical protein